MYKADLHTHTMFSDGRVTPEWRVDEAWMDGLDVVAITDHIENRPYVVRIPKYLDGVEVKMEKEKDIAVDLNASVKAALLSHRTIAYAFDQMAGEESLLQALFNACVTAEFVRVDSICRHFRSLSASVARIRHGSSRSVQFHSRWSRTLSNLL